MSELTPVAETRWICRPSGACAIWLVIDSLRYWAEEIGVDGFRFDLAAALGRAAADFDPNSAFLGAVGQDPVLSGVKLIAEPWDIGWGGYDLGRFPSGWSEWNGKFRDTIRDFLALEGWDAPAFRHAPERLPRPVRPRWAPADRLGQHHHRP